MVKKTTLQDLEERFDVLTRIITEIREENTERFRSAKLYTDDTVKRVIESNKDERYHTQDEIRKSASQLRKEIYEGIDKFKESLKAVGNLEQLQSQRVDTMVSITNHIKAGRDFKVVEETNYLKIINDAIEKNKRLLGDSKRILESITKFVQNQNQ
jgi:hypothetical protein